MYRSLATSAVALITAAAPVLADVTPDEVWTSLSNYYTGMGYEVSEGSRDLAGETLTLSDVVVSSDSADADFTVTIPQLTLQQTGDAGVRTVIGGEIIAEMVSESSDEDDVSVHVAISMPDNSMLSSGSPDDMTHRISYPLTNVTARILTSPDAGDGAENPFKATLTDMDGTYRMVSSDTGIETTYDVTVAATDLALALTDIPAEDGSDATGSMDGTAQLADLTLTGRMTMPSGDFSMADQMHMALNAGMALDGQVALGPSSGEIRFSGTGPEGEDQSGDAKFSNDSSEFAVTMSKDGLSYTGSATGSSAELMMNDLPFPISYVAESASGGVSLPISASDAPQPFKLNYALAGLSLSDQIWTMLDPEQQLPRDPANLTIDVEGQAMITRDLMDPALAEQMSRAAEQMEAQDGMAPDPGSMQPDMPMPFEAQSVKINQITLDAVGVKADLTGDLTMPEGLAQPPVGTIEGSFAGVNALLGKLVEMGIVPQEQVMGARMMIAMFARPVEGDPDQLQTKLEFREDGSIFANGQQVK